MMRPELFASIDGAEAVGTRASSVTNLETLAALSRKASVISFVPGSARFQRALFGILPNTTLGVIGIRRAECSSLHAGSVGCREVLPFLQTKLCLIHPFSP